MSPGRRRGLLLLAMAAMAGALSLTLVARQSRDITTQVGSKQQVVVAKRKIPKKTVFTPDNAERYLETSEIPELFVPIEHFRYETEVLGFVTTVAIPAGTYPNRAQLRTGSFDAPAPQIERGKRAVDVVVDASRVVTTMMGQGSKVDVLVTNDLGDLGGRTRLVFEDIPVLEVRPLSGEEGGGKPGASDAPSNKLEVTLIVGLRQAVTLTAAQNFAKDIRLLPRPPGDRRLAGKITAAG